MSQSFFVLDRAEVAFITSWQGSVGRDIERRARTLAFRARGSVGVRTGRLRALLDYTPQVYAEGVGAKIGSPVGYSLVHHTGSRPHVIQPRRAKALRFRMGARVVYARSVNHPGTHPNPYLTRWLKEAVS